MNPITFNFTGALQTYQVTVTGSYTLTAFGAQGGDDGLSATGGAGASVSGLFGLQGGTQLLILVGGRGANGSITGGGGGGGSFVYDDVDRSGTIDAGDVLLLAAGGGGGAGFQVNATGRTATTVGSGTGNGGGDGHSNGFSNFNGGGGAGINGGGGGDRVEPLAFRAVERAFPAAAAATAVVVV